MIINVCNDIANKRTISKHDLQSLLGKPLYISLIIRLARAFLNHMLNTLRSTGDDQRVQVGGDFQMDLNWFRVFARRFNDCTTFKNWGIEAHDTMHIDASLLGLGGVSSNQFHSAYHHTFKTKEELLCLK